MPNRTTWIILLTLTITGCKKDESKSAGAIDTTNTGRHLLEAQNRNPKDFSDVSTILVAEYLGNQRVLYRKPRARIPLEHRTYRLNDGRVIDVPLLKIICFPVPFDTCSIRRMENWVHELEFHSVNHKKLTWLPETDLVGLPASDGGRTFLSSTEEGYELPFPPPGTLGE